MIAIVNIDENLRDSGPHEYEVRINYKPIARFTHNREERLSRCLERAASAVRREEIIEELEW